LQRLDPAGVPLQLGRVVQLAGGLYHFRQVHAGGVHALQGPPRRVAARQGRGGVVRARLHFLLTKKKAPKFVGGFLLLLREQGTTQQQQ
jgi:hypothetical protein